MIQFTKSDKRSIGHIEIQQLVTIDDGKVCATAGRAGLKPYFMVLVSFNSSGPFCMDQVPTGIFKIPYIPSPDEIIITDGDNFTAARHATPEQLQYNATPEQAEKEQIPSDPDLYILDDGGLPDRLKSMTTADKDRILDKVRAYCSEIYQKG